MESRINLENITNGLLVLQRLKQLYAPPLRDEEGQNDTYLQPDRLTLLQDTLSAIANLMPPTRGSTFNEAFRLGSHYSSTYRGIKQHVSTMSGSAFDMPQLLKTLKIIAPVFSSRQKVYMDKVIRIVDVLES